jgi:hypothetical protein
MGYMITAVISVNISLLLYFYHKMGLLVSQSYVLTDWLKVPLNIIMKYTSKGILFLEGKGKLFSIAFTELRTSFSV